MELWTQRGGAGRYRNIISQEYAPYPLLRWSRDFRIEQFRAALWNAAMVWIIRDLASPFPEIYISSRLAVQKTMRPKGVHIVSLLMLLHTWQRRNHAWAINGSSLLTFSTARAIWIWMCPDSNKDYSLPRSDDRQSFNSVPLRSAASEVMEKCSIYLHIANPSLFLTELNATKECLRFVFCKTVGLKSGRKALIRTSVLLCCIWTKNWLENDRIKQYST